MGHQARHPVRRPESHRAIFFGACAGSLWLTADDRRHLRLYDGETGKLACTIQLPLPVIAIAAIERGTGECLVGATMNSGDVIALRLEGMNEANR